MGNTICFIPVRKGSKSILGKNIRELGGKPLVCWILDTLLSSNISDEVWIATDCDKMETLITERYNGSVKIFRRSEYNARDESPTIDIVNEFLEINKPNKDSRFVLLQATSPFTSVQELHTLIEEMNKGEYDSFVACCRLRKFHWSEDGKPLDYSFQTKPRRQEYKGLLIESGAFYASTVRAILDSKNHLSGSIKVMEIGPAGMIDIDEEEDWKLAEHHIKTQLLRRD